MGLDVSHGAWNGGYGSFGSFRAALAAAIGIDLDAMHGFQERADIAGLSWPSPESEPLVYLLDHSDCDGEIAVPALLPLARRLREVAPLLTPEMPFVRGWASAFRTMRRIMPAVAACAYEPRFSDAIMERWRNAAIQFAEGCEQAAAAGEPIEFF